MNMFIKQYTLIINLIIIIKVNTSDDEQRLLTDLFRKYNKEVRPVRYDNDTVVVRAKHTISQILEVREKNEVFVTTGWSSLRWRDAYMTWNPKDYNGIKTINISPGKLWIPDIVLYTDIKSDKAFGEKVDQVQNRLSLIHDGRVIWGLKATFSTKCHFDIYYFPFDIQSCDFRYGSWSYEKGRIDISPESSIEIDYLAKHNGWDILQHTTKMVNENYSDKVYESVKFNVKFKRRAFFGIVNLILSPIIVGLLISLSFILPAASGERLALSVTLLLAMIFFIINVTYFIPNDNTNVPVVYQFFIATLFEIVVLNVALILSMQLHHKKPYDPDMSYRIRALLLDKVAYWVGVRDVRHKSGISDLENGDLEKIVEFGFIPNEEEDDRFDRYWKEGPPYNGSLYKTCRSQLYRKITMEWRIIAMCIDRCLFIFFSFTWFVTFAVFVFKLTSSPYDTRHGHH